MPTRSSVMTELSSKKNAPYLTESLSGGAELQAQDQSRVKPVRVWAAVGGAILALQLYVWIRWITGPYFQRSQTARAIRRCS